MESQLHDWSEFVDSIKVAYGLSTELVVERAGLTRTLIVVPETREVPTVHMVSWELLLL